MDMMQDKQKKHKKTTDAKKPRTKSAKKRAAEKKKNGKRKQIGHVLLGTLAVLLMLAAFLGLAFILVYKTGQARLMQSVDAKTPDAAEIGDMEAELVAKEKAKLSTVEWQDNWVAIGDKVYAYDEKCINLLFLGVDKAGSLSKETDYENWEAGQTDAIFVVSLNPSKKRVDIVGIPRNSMVTVDIYDEEDHKIDTVYDQICLQYAFAGGGAEGLERVKLSASELLYGLPIHGGFAVGYDAVGIVNDMAGGVDIEVLEDLSQKNKAFVAGKQLHLDGELALSYVRERNYGQLGSPTLRLKRQKQYLMALIAQMRGAVKENPALIKDMYTAVAQYMNTDVTLEEVVYLAAQAIDYEFPADAFHLLEGEDRAVAIPEDMLKKGEEAEPFYDDYYLDEEQVKQVMLDVFYDEVSIGK